MKIQDIIKKYTWIHYYSWYNHDIWILKNWDYIKDMLDIKDERKIIVITKKDWKIILIDKIEWIKKELIPIKSFKKEELKQILESLYEDSSKNSYEVKIR